MPPLQVHLVGLSPSLPRTPGLWAASWPGHLGPCPPKGRGSPRPGKSSVGGRSGEGRDLGFCLLTGAPAAAQGTASGRLKPAFSETEPAPGVRGGTVMFSDRWGRQTGLSATETGPAVPFESAGAHLPSGSRRLIRKLAVSLQPSRRAGAGVLGGRTADRPATPHTHGSRVGPLTGGCTMSGVGEPRGLV